MVYYKTVNGTEIKWSRLDTKTDIINIIYVDKKADKIGINTFKCMKNYKPTGVTSIISKEIFDKVLEKATEKFKEYAN